MAADPAIDAVHIDLSAGLSIDERVIRRLLCARLWPDGCFGLKNLDLERIKPRRFPPTPSVPTSNHECPPALLFGLLLRMKVSAAGRLVTAALEEPDPAMNAAAQAPASPSRMKVIQAVPVCDARRDPWRDG
jgi:hypothetical protein